MTEQPESYEVFPTNKEPHQHTYQVTTSGVTVRWCSSCGKSWMMMQHGTGATARYTWEEIREPLI